MHFFCQNRWKMIRISSHQTLSQTPNLLHKENPMSSHQTESQTPNPMSSHHTENQTTNHQTAESFLHRHHRI